MPKGVPDRVLDEFNRRGEPVTVRVTLDRGQLEDLEALSQVRHAAARSRSALIRDGVGWLLAREAMQIVRGQGIDKRRAELAARERNAIQFSRQEREQRDQAHELEKALAIARAETKEPEPGPDPLAAIAAQVAEMQAKIDALRQS